MKKVAMILVPVLAIGGVVVAGKLGVVKIPGLSPAAKQKAAAKLYSEEKDPAESKPAPEAKSNPKPKDPPVVQVKADVIDEVAGRKKVAKLWNDLEPAKVVAITKSWKDEELAQILVLMDAEKVSQFLSTVDAARAERLSRAVMKVASRIPKT